MTKPVPNFVRHDPSHPDIAILIEVMLKARTQDARQRPGLKHPWVRDQVSYFDFGTERSAYSAM